jgi:hypothetical protein
MEGRGDVLQVEATSRTWLGVTTPLAFLLEYEIFNYSWLSDDENTKERAYTQEALFQIREWKMKGYVSVYRIADGQILANISKFRIYARLQGFISEGIFHKGQSALDATFALMASLNPPHIDYILDMRFSDPWPNDILKLWKKKAIKTLSEYPQVYAVGVAADDSPFWLQVFDIKVLFEEHGDRILRTFRTPQEAEAYLDKLRHVESL